MHAAYLFGTLIAAHPVSLLGGDADVVGNASSAVNASASGALGGVVPLPPSGLTSAEVIGVAVGAIAAASVLACVAFFLLCRCSARRRSRRSPNSASFPTVESSSGALDSCQKPESYPPSQHGGCEVSMDATTSTSIAVPTAQEPPEPLRPKVLLCEQQETKASAFTFTSESGCEAQLPPAPLLDPTPQSTEHVLDIPLRAPLLEPPVPMEQVAETPVQEALLEVKALELSVYVEHAPAITASLIEPPVPVEQVAETPRTATLLDLPMQPVAQGLLQQPAPLDEPPVPSTEQVVETSATQD